MSLEERYEYSMAVLKVKAHGMTPVTREYIEILLDLQDRFTSAYHAYQEAGCEEPMDEEKLDALLAHMNALGDELAKEMSDTFGELK